jgi:hypothetical protein
MLARFAVRFRWSSPDKNSFTVATDLAVGKSVMVSANSLSSVVQNTAKMFRAQKRISPADST